MVSDLGGRNVLCGAWLGMVSSKVFGNREGGTRKIVESHAIRRFLQ